METFSALLAICAGNSPVPAEFPAERPVTRSVDVFFDLRLTKRLSKQSWGWWFETLPRPLCCHSSALTLAETLFASPETTHDGHPNETPRRNRVLGFPSMCLPWYLHGANEVCWRTGSINTVVKVHIMCALEHLNIEVWRQPTFSSNTFSSKKKFGFFEVSLKFVLTNKVWWQCLVPTSTTRFSSDVGYRMAKM